MLKLRHGHNIITIKYIDEIIPNYGTLICNLFTYCWFDNDNESTGDFLYIDNSFLEKKFKDSNCFKINIMKNKSLSWHKVLDNYIPDKGKQLLYKKDIMYIAKVQLTKLTHRGYTNLTIEKIFNYLESKYDKIGKKYYRKKEQN